jgi:hypothetical protein
VQPILTYDLILAGLRLLRNRGVPPLFAGLFGRLGSSGLALRPLRALSGAGGLGFGFRDFGWAGAVVLADAVPAVQAAQRRGCPPAGVAAAAWWRARAAS